MWRSLVYFPTALSSNWLSILLPLLIWAVGEGIRVRKQGWGAMRWETIARETWLMIGLYGLLFGWAVIRTVYEDHRSLMLANQSLRSQYTSGLNLQIDSTLVGYRSNQQTVQTVVFLVASVANTGYPTIAEFWQLQVKLPSGKTESTVTASFMQNKPINLIWVFT
jgi:hypothetical protein